jgi:hypothetical protein
MSKEFEALDRIDTEIGVLDGFATVLRSHATTHHEKDGGLLYLANQLRVHVEALSKAHDKAHTLLCVAGKAGEARP